MGKKLGLDKLYKSIGVFPTTSKFKERSLKLRAGNPSKLPSSALTVGKPLVNSKFMERSLKLRAGTSDGKKYPTALTTSVNKSSKLLNIGKKVLGRTPVGRAINLAVNVGSGIGIGYSYAKNKFKGKSETKVDKKSAGGEMNQMNIKGYMGGGASRGYGAARTSGMGLQDESLMPGKMVRASEGKAVRPYNPKDKKQKKITDKQNPHSLYDSKTGKLIYTAAKNGKMVKMNRGGGMDAGAAQNKADFRARVIKYAQKNKGEDRVTQSDIKMAEKTLTAMNKLKK